MYHASSVSIHPNQQEDATNVHGGEKTPDFVAPG